MSKMTYSESEADSNFAINLLSTFAPIFSEYESDFSSVFINLDICMFLALFYTLQNMLVEVYFYQFP